MKFNVAGSRRPDSTLNKTFAAPAVVEKFPPGLEFAKPEGTSVIVLASVAKPAAVPANGEG